MNGEYLMSDQAVDDFKWFMAGMYLGFLERGEPDVLERNEAMLRQETDDDDLSYAEQDFVRAEIEAIEMARSEYAGTP